tara:strand:- start:343 stop:543 length:201 start_codon:yes stop_codon:yes gene_type:complete
MERHRDYIEMTFVWNDKRRKKSVRFLELKEMRLVNQLYSHEEMDCIEIRIKTHFGTREEFEEINFG